MKSLKINTENLLKNHKSQETKNVVLYTFGIHRVPVVELTDRLAVSVSVTTGPPCIIPYIANTKVPKNKKQGSVNN